MTLSWMAWTWQKASFFGFIALLGSAYIFLAWLGILGTPLWGPLAIALIFSFAVFRWV